MGGPAAEQTITRQILSETPKGGQSCDSAEVKPDLSAQERGRQGWGAEWRPALQRRFAPQPRTL